MKQNKHCVVHKPISNRLKEAKMVFEAARQTKVATHFATRHGERIMADIGIDPRLTQVDLDGLKASMGVPTDTPSLTYRELQERRRLIQRRMAAHRRGRSTGPTGSTGSTGSTGEAGEPG